MVTRPRYGYRATAPLVALMITIPLVVAGCFGRVEPSSEPTASAPVVTPTPVQPTLPPEETATPEPQTPPPTAPPTAPPTESPTVQPTANEHPNWPPGALTARDAADHLGEVATVCGTVNTVRWIFGETGHPTWLNFNRPYPNMRFNAVIWGEQRRAWPLGGKPEDIYPGHEVCVTGLVEGYSSWVQIQNLTIGDIEVVS